MIGLVLKMGYVDGPASYRRPPLLNARKRGRSTPSKFSSKARRDLGITLKQLDEDPLNVPAGMAPWEPWPAHLAAERFEETLRGLIRARQEIVPVPGHVGFNHVEAAE